MPPPPTTLPAPMARKPPSSPSTLVEPPSSLPLRPLLPHPRRPPPPLRSPLTSWRGAVAGRGAVVADPRAAALPRRSDDGCDRDSLELLPV
jgi:hypothetical protein